MSSLLARCRKALFRPTILYSFNVVWFSSKGRKIAIPPKESTFAPSHYSRSQYFVRIIDQKTRDQGPAYLENLFDHLIVHYIFCPRSLQEASLLALAALTGLEKAREAG
ncbi:MAG: hypothetical protein WCW68_10770 [Methanothrix sp.]